MTKFVAIPGVLLAFALVGCAKQPSTTQGSAPAPDGAVGMRMTSPGMDPASATGGGRGMSGSGSTRPSLEGFRATGSLNDIHFDFDRAEVREADGPVLDANAGWLKANPGQMVVIEGHTDERGTNEYNTALGDRRAKATMNYLVSRGVAASRIAVISYGEERPACKQHVDACWAENRRAHFLVKGR
jgi:peptidoglycan-associated lipoprotein